MTQAYAAIGKIAASMSLGNSPFWHVTFKTRLQAQKIEVKRKKSASYFPLQKPTINK